jgi:phosphatidylserine decarboxylase
MRAVRQGDCPECPHDIIDPRDLKYVRNVCGYWFRIEDDAFRWRSRLGLARAGLCEVVCFCALFGVVTAAILIAGTMTHPVLFLALPVVLYFWFEAIYFFRDPHRQIPSDASVLLSPADGTVTHVEEIDDADFPGGRAFRISIFLSVFNVHVNRVPRSGRAIRVRYFPGSFFDARRPDCAAQNEQLWIDIQESDSARLVRVKQISGAVARRIVCWLRAGENVVAGDRFGMIKYGSRTDVLIPVVDSFDVKVRVGERVQGGSTILLRYRETGADTRQLDP